MIRLAQRNAERPTTCETRAATEERLPYFYAMPGNSFGKHFRITSFGESHGEMIGVVMDGCPAGLLLDEDFIQHELDRRRPGQSGLTTARKESDRFRFVSGIMDGKTTGQPLTAVIMNTGHKPQDYDSMKDLFRPSHADYTYEAKYGIRDHRGGGRASARETATRVLAGAVARLLLHQEGVRVSAYVSRVGTVTLQKSFRELDLSATDAHPVRCPDQAAAAEMALLIEEARDRGDSVGGVITCVAEHVPAGLGEPVFDKLQADLARAMLSINAVHGFEYGSGFEGASMFGSDHNDEFIIEKEKVTTRTNRSGGIQGGISNGADIYFNVAFKPVATIAQKQQTVTRDGKATELEAKGRHDPCVVPRAVPVVEAMTALVLADHWLRNQTARMPVTEK